MGFASPAARTDALDGAVYSVQYSIHPLASSRRRCNPFAVRTRPGQFFRSPREFLRRLMPVLLGPRYFNAKHRPQVGNRGVR